ncbi:tautomerase family protein [Streptomyces sp. JJ66]|uniref:tautomerase family protein n=1 Tax=Streptomyces sp. JJ66 TaxID=2803843 RepID=UPI001C57114C|nr:tautomerase family protein [Streptomyces sp. JJ66]MBW1602691.1 tautomerase family protein [Streptomyces sp. JJ66]
MPHVSIKHWPRPFTAAAQAELVGSLTETITRTFGCEPDSVSIAVESVEPSRWRDEVQLPELEQRAHLLWKQPKHTQPLSAARTAEGTR